MNKTDPSYAKGESHEDSRLLGREVPFRLASEETKEFLLLEWLSGNGEQVIACIGDD